MKLISLNVEGDKHSDRIVPFLEEEKPDVFCAQEIFEEDVQVLATQLQMKSVFSPMFLKPKPLIDANAPLHPMGIAILSRFPIKNTSVFPYHAPNGDEIIQFNNKPFDMIRKTTRSSLLTVEVEGETTYRVGTIHFTWTPDGLPNEYQRADANALLKILEQFPDIVVCGDFNMPRGFNDIYTLFTDRFTDVIPQSYISSLDMTYHRVKDDKEQMAVLSGYMVDYVFVSNAYEAKEVKLIQGVSDHCAVSAGVYKKAI